MTDTTSDQTKDPVNTDQPGTEETAAASQPADPLVASEPPDPVLAAPEPSPPDLGISVSDVSATEDGLR